MQRTADFQLPKHGGELITTLETQLDRYYLVMMTDSTIVIFSPSQHAELQNALVNLVRARLR